MQLSDIITTTTAQKLYGATIDYNVRRIAPNLPTGIIRVIATTATTANHKITPKLWLDVARHAGQSYFIAFSHTDYQIINIPAPLKLKNHILHKISRMLSTHSIAFVYFRAIPVTCKNWQIIKDRVYQQRVPDCAQYQQTPEELAPQKAINAQLSKFAEIANDVVKRRKRSNAISFAEMQNRKRHAEKIEQYGNLQYLANSLTI